MMMNETNRSAIRHGASNSKLLSPGPRLATLAVLVNLLWLPHAGAELFEDLALAEHLQLFPIRPKVGDPDTVAALGEEGPKGIAIADFDADGNPDLAVSTLDGTVSVLLGKGAGDFPETSRSHVQTGAISLRGIIATDLNGDGRPDIATAAPFDQKVILLFGDGTGGFLPAQSLEAWPGARNLVAGDFDGDGVPDLAVAGPGVGLRHYRGSGGGMFEPIGDLRQLGPLSFDFPKPVFSLATMPSQDGLRDDLVLTHAESDRVWILGTMDAEGSAGEAVDPARQALPTSLPDTPLVITEFMAENASTARDSDGELSDWIEIFNRSSGAVGLLGWSLTDRADSPRKWEFPDVTLEPGQFLLVFASGKNRRSPGGELHTNFKLSKGGEYLALVAPGVAQVAHDFGELFPDQVADISYGLSHDGLEQFFDLPSPGSVNNAGTEILDDLRLIGIENIVFRSLDETPQGLPVEVSVRVGGAELLNRVWFTYRNGLSDTAVQMTRSLTPADTYLAVLPAGEYSPGDPYNLIGQRSDGSSVQLGQVDAAIRDPRALKVLASLPSQSARSLAVGALMEPAADGALDLITANRDQGTIEIRQGNGQPYRFDHAVHQTLSVPGGPRGLAIADLDHDGWNDLVVVLRNADLVVTYRNEQGTLVRDSVASTGVSPREVAVADFNDDGQPDAAIINRSSSDVTILTTVPDEVAFQRIDQIYPVDGEISAIRLFDFNDDGFDDVILLHRRTNDFSVRLFSAATGHLGDPTFYPMGKLPEDIEIEDCDEDGDEDLISSNQGDGSVSVRLNTGAGFSSEVSYPLTPTSTPPDRLGILSAEAQDFNGDGKVDLVALLFDCRIAFYEGLGDGRFVAPPEDEWHDFVYEPRVILPGDLDEDGDLDLVGVGVTGEIVVVENRGDFLSAGKGELKMTRPPVPPGDEHFNAKYIRGVKVNDDNDLDLLVGTGRGVLLYLGTDGVGFEPAGGILDGTDFPVAGLVSEDFDSNGTPDVAVSCKVLSCISLLTKDENDEYAHALTVDVPAGKFLATGDLDGDGHPDLVGAGDVLWIALSGTPPGVAAAASSGTRERLNQVVINEILARNGGVPLIQDGGKNTDFVEIYNGDSKGLSLIGWTLVYSPPGGEGNPADENRFVFPADADLPPGGHRLVLFSSDIARSPYHTGFKLPSEGGILTLRNAGGVLVDQLEYPNQQEDISYGRYEDAFGVFSFNPIPSPGRENQDDGPVDPVLEFLGYQSSAITPNAPIRFSAVGDDDVGIISVSVLWQYVNGDDRRTRRLVLFDDGRHGDGELLDGLYSNVLDVGLPAGSEIQFYLEAEDLSGRIQTIPGSPAFALPGEQIEIFSLGIDSGETTLQITEIVADNREAYQEPGGGDPDYVEIRNYGLEPVALDGLILAKDFLADLEEVFVFPPGTVLEPGESILVLADGNTDEGPLHSPYRIDPDGDQLYLLGTGQNGAHTVIDFVRSVELDQDEALYRVGDVWLKGAASPQMDNPQSEHIGEALNADGETVWAYIFPTEPGIFYIPRTSPSMAKWTELDPLDPIVGDGRFHSVTQTVGEKKGFFSLRIIPAVLPQFESQLVNLTRNAAEITGRILDPGGDIPQITIYYGATDGGTDPADWDSALELGKQGDLFGGVIGGLEDDRDYYYQVVAENRAGRTWSPATESFHTFSAEYANPEIADVSDVTTTGANIAGRITPGTAGAAEIVVFWGRTDGGTNPDAWENSSVLTLGAGGSFDIGLPGLEQDTRYFVRLRAENPAGDTWTASSVSFETWSMLEAIRESLVISEIMYHPAPAPPGLSAIGFVEDDFEFIEIFNRGSIPLDLSQLRLSGGIRYVFPAASNPILDAGEFAILVRSRRAFELRYGPRPTQAVIGEWLSPFLSPAETRLSNSGERLTFTFGIADDIIFDFEYGDGNFAPEPDSGDPDNNAIGWPRRADGEGSLVVLDRFATPDPANPLRWTTSRVLRGSPGQAEFSTKFQLAARLPAERRSLSWLDYDGDGDLDLVGWVANSPRLSIYSNSGDGTFTAVQTELLSDEPIAQIIDLAWGDYDGDKDLDVAILSARSAEPNVLEIYRNSGSGTFIDIQAGLPSGNRSVDWVDLNGDGDVDLLLTQRVESHHLIHIYQNQGGTSFWEFENALPAALSAEWGDYDRDGDLDVALSGTSLESPRIFRNDGGGTFVEIQVSILNGFAEWADSDGDGDLDILLSGGEATRIYLNEGSDQFIDVFDTETRLPGTSGVDWGDYDRDGDLDALLTVDTVSPFTYDIYRNDQGEFTDIGADLPAVGSPLGEWRDYDGDGDLDVLLGTRIYRNDGGGAFVESVTGIPWLAGEWGDYDGDGDLDVLTGSLIYRNDESEWVSPGDPPATTLQITEIMYHALLGDMDIAAGFGDDDDFDFIEIKNVGDQRVQLDDLGLDGSISFDFAAGSVRELAPGEYVLLVANRAAFAYRYGESLAVAGEWFGRLGNEDGRLAWVDLVSGVVSDSVHYDEIDDEDDGDGFSLVIGGGSDNRWRTSSLFFGSPGAEDIGSYQDWLGIHFTADEQLTPQLVNRAADPDGDGRTNQDEYAFNSDPRSAQGNLLPMEIVTISEDGQLHPALRLARQALASDLVYLLESSTDLIHWNLLDTGADSSPRGDFRIELTRDAQFFRARAVEPELLGVTNAVTSWGDVDGDGDLDILLGGRNQHGRPITRIYRNNFGVFVEADQFETFSNAGWGDFDGDTKLEVRSLDDWTLEAYGDYNDDGFLDILQANSDTSTAALILRNTGVDPPKFQSISIPDLQGHHSIDWGDFDGDGSLDILLAGGTSTSIYRNPSTVFIDTGYTWKYLADGSDQGTAWRAPSFDDSAWPSGPSQLGYGDRDEATDVGWVDVDPVQPGAQKNATTYFRTTVTIPDPVVFANLDAQITYDDTFAIYVNGVEVARHSNLSENAPFDEYGAVDVPDNARATHTLAASAFVAGTNTIAVEIHQSKAESSDISFDFKLTGIRPEIQFEDIGAGLPGVRNGSAAWDDYDGDQDLDILIVGASADGPIAKIYRNDDGAFSDIGAGLPGVSTGSALWGDYDNDGDSDILLIESGGLGIGTRIYRNDNGAFVDIEANLPEVRRGSAAWGDYDNDGDLDLLLVGQSGTDNTLFARIYRNDGNGQFTPQF